MAIAVGLFTVISGVGGHMYLCYFASVLIMAITTMLVADVYWNPLGRTLQPFGTFSCWIDSKYSLQWRHNGCDGVSNHQPHHFYSTVYSGADQRKHQSSASLAFVCGIHRWPVNSAHKWPVTRKKFPFHDVIMSWVSRHSLTRYCRHFDEIFIRLHRKLSKWQLLVQTMMEISSKWQHFRYSVVCSCGTYPV